ncbi:hypothetical protein [Iodidimonas nitroreducens]|uniref:hypothetical protein n=1 Tax=Iodidimonas nitroreducens TaxID=1236968 RepID=UPI0028D7CD1D|nr:hypothetical protein [Iodidimonas nitroreducens]
MIFDANTRKFCDSLYRRFINRHRFPYPVALFHLKSASKAQKHLLRRHCGGRYTLISARAREAARLFQLARSTLKGNNKDKIDQKGSKHMARIFLYGIASSLAC